VGIRNKASDEMVKRAIELGMTPSARTRVATIKPKEPANLAEEFAAFMEK
jgi:hypothetical protein